MSRTSVGRGAARGGWLWAAACALLLAPAFPAAAAAQDSSFAGSSEDGSRVFISSYEQLVAEDTDARLDVYERAAGATTVISRGEVNGNGDLDAFFAHASVDGSRVVFETAEPLVEADTDSSVDVYQRSGASLSLLSTGPTGGQAAFAADFRGATPDGEHVYFHTNEALVPEDADASQDVYESFQGQTTLVSRGAVNGNGTYTASYAGATDDGTHVFFTSAERLASTDTDSYTDVYDRAGGVTAHVSRGAINGNGSYSASFRAASSDGTRVVLTTRERLHGNDTDSRDDVYARDAASGTTTLLSRSTVNGINGNGSYTASFRCASDDARSVVLQTSERLLSEDTDSASDLYGMLSNGALVRVSRGEINGNGAYSTTFRGCSEDAGEGFFETAERLVSEDTDSVTDVYQGVGDSSAPATLISHGEISGALSVTYAGATQDGSHVYFETADRLSESDPDTQTDVYVRSSSAGTQLVSLGEQESQPAAADFGGVSNDGSRVFFQTAEPLTADDGESSLDVYERTAGTTRLLSVDAAPPQTVLQSAPPSLGNDPTPSFGFSASEQASFQCRLDGPSWQPCTSGYVADPLADGDHDFSVRAIDRAGNVDATPASAEFSVDAGPPQTILESSPPSLGNDPSPSFGFSASEPASFECRLDGPAWQPCAPGYVADPLADGDHAFDVRAIDRAGNVDATPASAGFSVETGPPETSVDYGPSGLQNDPTPSFGFSASEPGSFQCRVNGLSWQPCAPGYTPDPLADGDHDFSVRAIDRAGNIDPTPAGMGFSVETAPPDTHLDYGPPALSNDLTPDFGFSASEPSVAFECSLDDVWWLPCTPPFRSAAVTDGEHSFAVRAIDRAGNIDSTPAQTSFRVKTGLPNTTITKGPQVRGHKVTVEFKADEPARFSCHLDSRPWSACDSPKNYRLKPGTYQFEVKATDEAGNVERIPAQQSFRVRRR